MCENCLSKKDLGHIKCVECSTIVCSCCAHQIIWEFVDGVTCHADFNEKYGCKSKRPMRLILNDDLSWCNCCPITTKRTINIT